MSQEWLIVAREGRGERLFNFYSRLMVFLTCDCFDIFFNR